MFAFDCNLFSLSVVRFLKATLIALIGFGTLFVQPLFASGGAPQIAPGYA